MCIQEGMPGANDGLWCTLEGGHSAKHGGMLPDVRVGKTWTTFCASPGGLSAQRFCARLGTGLLCMLCSAPARLFLDCYLGQWGIHLWLTWA